MVVVVVVVLEDAEYSLAVRNNVGGVGGGGVGGGGRGAGGACFRVLTRHVLTAVVGVRSVVVIVVVAIVAVVVGAGGDDDDKWC